MAWNDNQITMIDNIHLLDLTGKELEELMDAARWQRQMANTTFIVIGADPVMVHIVAIQGPTTSVTQGQTILETTESMFKPYVKDRILFVAALPYNSHAEYSQLKPLN
jgi:hypothetical protein